MAPVFSHISQATWGFLHWKFLKAPEFFIEGTHCRISWNGVDEPWITSPVYFNLEKANATKNHGPILRCI